MSFDLDRAIAKHYARQQEGLPPVSPSQDYLRVPFSRYLREYYPVPPPPGGWVRPIPTFDWWLEHRWPYPVQARPLPPVADPAPEA